MSKRTLRIVGVTVVLSLILIVLPIVSYFVLNAGLDYRREKIEALGDYGKSQLNKARTPSGFVLDKNQLKDHIVLYASSQATCGSESHTLTEFVEKFIAHQDFRFVIVEKDTPSCLTSSDIYIAKFESNQDLWNQMIGMESDHSLEHVIFLSDRYGTMRSAYDLRTKESVEMMVAHTSLLLPPQKRRG